MTGEVRIPRWPRRLSLSFLLVVEVILILKLIGEGIAGNVTLFVNSLGIVLACLLTWRGIPWARWLLEALIVWRLVEIGMDIAAHFAPDDHRLPGTLILVALYVAAGAVVASPLGRPAAGAAR
jgi:hypothetical protein